MSETLTDIQLKALETIAKTSLLKTSLGEQATAEIHELREKLKAREWPKVLQIKVENSRLRKTIRKISKHGCSGPGAYDALPCEGYIPEKDWCGSCLANAALKERARR